MKTTGYSDPGPGSSSGFPGGRIPWPCFPFLNELRRVVGIGSDRPLLPSRVAPGGGSGGGVCPPIGPGNGVGRSPPPGWTSGLFRKRRKCPSWRRPEPCAMGFFNLVLEKHRADKVALAHTANDQAEEVLIGLIRGAGLGGLSGMPLQRACLYSPAAGHLPERKSWPI